MIEILVVRDPDNADEITVWRDGVEICGDDEVIVAYVDAGAGYDFGDWRENADFWEKRDDLSDTFHEAVNEAYFDPPGRQYIDGFMELDRYPFKCVTCGRAGTEDDMCELGEPCPDEECDGIIEHNWKEPE